MANDMWGMFVGVVGMDAGEGKKRRRNWRALYFPFDVEREERES
jgi:hypothetical protein